MVVECRVKGEQVKSANVFFAVRKEFKIVKLHESIMSEKKKVLWIPFDMNMLERNRLESSGEETGGTYSRDIYKYMEDMPSDAANSNKLKRRPKLDQKKVKKFVDEKHPTFLSFVSGTSMSSYSFMSAQFLFLLVSFHLYIL